jgi:hypothetical protein
MIPKEKLLLIIETLPESALEEACEELEKIAHFYQERSPQVSAPIPTTIRGKLRSTQIRPPIVLE